MSEVYARCNQTFNKAGFLKFREYRFAANETLKQNLDGEFILESAEQFAAGRDDG
jgi:hypothetical protein